MICAFIDPLTHVKNKGAFLLAVEELQEQINNGSIDPNFALGEFDCDGLKASRISNMPSITASITPPPPDTLSGKVIL